MIDFQKLLRMAVESRASDVHVQAAAPPMMRISGQMRAVDSPPLTNDEARAFIASIAPEDVKSDLDAASFAGLDFSYEVHGLSRFRCSAFRQLGRLGITIRIVRTAIPSLDSLKLPGVIQDIALSRRGLTLVTGTTGSGKSTTLAAMIDIINQSERAKIITIEDPVEFLHASKKALISQIQVGSDTPSFAQALRQALRQDPDVILIGELRDVETLRIALSAADTGHQVFSTVHSADAAQTIERIITMFPPNEHKLLLSQLAGSIEAIVSQRLVTTMQDQRCPAVEVLRGSAVAGRYILENRLAELRAYIETGESGMQTFDQHLLAIFNDGQIRASEALRCSTNPEALAMALRGIKASGGGKR